MKKPLPKSITDCFKPIPGLKEVNEIHDVEGLTSLLKTLGCPEEDITELVKQLNKDKPKEGA